MADPLYFLDQASRDKLRALLARDTARPRPNRTLSVEPDPTWFPPEVYAARAPTGGIPALDRQTTGTGSLDLGDDRPGSATCDTYRIVEVGSSSVLRPVPGLTRKVYNFSVTAVPAYYWVLAVRDKWGRFWAVPGGGTDISGGIGVDEKAKVSSNDTTAGYLNGKLVVGENIQFKENADGGNETLTVAAKFSGARVFRTANQSINANTLTPINFTSEDYDTDAYHDNSTNNTRLTIPTNGYYHVGGNIGLENSSNDFEAILEIVRGDGRVLVVASVPSIGSLPTGGYGAELNVSCDMGFNAAQYVELQVYHTNPGGALNVQGSVEGLCNFWIHRIAPTNI